jgi:ABC-type polysaccharide/polyol phosphate export permease
MDRNIRNHFLGNIVIAPNPLPNPDHVPTIANGLMAAMSVLIAFAIFSLTHFHASIKDDNERWRYHLVAMLYLFVFFFLLMFGIMIGYRFVLTGELEYAYSTFMTLFIIMCGIILDMWTVSEQYYLK